MSRRALVSVNIQRGGHPGRVRGIPRAPRLADIAIAPLIDRPRDGLVSPYDARYISLKPSDLDPLIDRLLDAVDPTDIDVVLAISESGILPAFAFAARADLPLVVATEADAELPQAIVFEVGDWRSTGRTRRIYPLSADETVLIVEHHAVTGGSILRCVGALRAEGIACTQAATLLAVDDESLFARLADRDVTLHTAALVPSAVSRLLYRDRDPPIGS